MHGKPIDYEKKKNPTMKEELFFFFFLRNNERRIKMIIYAMLLTMPNSLKNKLIDHKNIIIN